MAVTGVAMLVTGVIASRIGPKPTLLGGLAIIVVFSALAGHSDTIDQIVEFRAGWGLGNALFIATALATIVGAASGGVASAIILYEAALGIGIATGPLVGGLLGGISWRGPFFGVAALMAIAFIAIAVFLPSLPKPARATSLADPFRALRHRSLLTVGITALLYNFGFFTLLAYTPFPLDMTAHQIGFIFFGWGLCLAVASVFVAPRLRLRFGTIRVVAVALTLFALDLAVMGLFTDHKPVLVVCVVVAGIFLGINNTLVTETVMVAAPVERGTASAAYLRAVRRRRGGPWLAGKLGETVSPHLSFYVGAGATAVGVLVLLSGRRVLAHVDRHEPAEQGVDEAQVLSAADA
ncbi:MFS transporter [Angustibacter aerolatus]|uniref:MFS transporter n=1 Tax=Angustibacter aerolatus TaxID=1162965 RepID=A0ABQ6JJ23_9ACTN|nr:MFS transporter [Angustibacter aerolatus]GMA86796.1 MFS transporter [Angustibacter aerolatus]